MSGRTKECFPLADILAGAKFISRIPSFVRRPITSAEASRTLAARLRNREADFLYLAKKGVYENPKNPFRTMLALAGCEYGDLVALVEKDGLENALRTLFRNGIYLTVNEFKGRVPAFRRGRSIDVAPGSLSNPLSQSHLRLHTSGSGGRRTFVPVDVAFVRERAVTLRLLLEARKGLAWHHGVWGVPGHTDLVRILELRGAGAGRISWFSQVKADATSLHPRYRWSIRLMRRAAWLGGGALPHPVHVPLSDPSPVVFWMTAALKSGRIPHLVTWASSAVRICRTAKAMGADIAGAQFSVGGEPLTAARLAAIRESGAAAVSRFMSVECGYIGYGCLNPEAPDDCHSVSDFTAVIQAGPEGEDRGLPPEALLLTSLRPASPFVFLNVSLGDQARIKRRSCGCPLETLGWTGHFSLIRSFEKLTSGGMTFLDSDLVRILEDTLPSRFGGGPLDYQLVEEESDEGAPRLNLHVSPEVGPVDEREVVRCFLEAVGRGSGAERVMSLQWKSAGIVTVKRERPRPSQTGKILHLLKTSK